MNKYHLLLSTLALLLIATSCSPKSKSKKNNTPQNYTYQEIVKVVNNRLLLSSGEETEKIIENAPDTIKAINDEAAYMSAYGRLVASNLMYAMLNDVNNQSLVYPQSFILKNNKGEDITKTVDIENRKEKENNIWKTHMEMEERINQGEPLRLTRLHTAKQIIINENDTIQ